MNVLKAKVHNFVNARFDNDPSLMLLVDEMPDGENLVYESLEKGSNTLYFAHYGGLVSFYAHAPNDERGYGGASFVLTLDDGSDVKIKGPWSSRSGVMNKHFEPHSLEVAITDDPEVWEKGHTFYGAAVAVDIALEAIKVAEHPEGFRHSFGWALARHSKWGDEIYYTPILVKNELIGKLLTEV